MLIDYNMFIHSKHIWLSRFIINMMISCKKGPSCGSYNEAILYRFCSIIYKPSLIYQATNSAQSVNVCRHLLLIPPSVIHNFMSPTSTNKRTVDYHFSHVPMFSSLSTWWCFLICDVSIGLYISLLISSLSYYKSLVCALKHTLTFVN